MSSTVSLAAAPNRRGAGQLRRLSLPIITLIGFIALWQIVVSVFRIPTYVMASPVDVYRELTRNTSVLVSNAIPTMIETVLGFLVGTAAAVIIAIIFVYSKAMERSFFPLVLFVRMVPIVAIAPILVIMFGTGMTPKIIVAALICFFPTLVNMVRGLQAVQPQMLELFRVLSATKWQLFFKVRLFSSMPYFFSSLRIAATSAVIGAVVAEWIGSQKGLGFLIVQSTYNFNVPLLYATMVVTAAFASVVYLCVGVVERFVVTWEANEDV
jgi:NitT/TauT family transport system permease protein